MFNLSTFALNDVSASRISSGERTITFLKQIALLKHLLVTERSSILMKVTDPSTRNGAINI